ncbi:MAG TPA: sodium-dependent transporter, partial [Firmicutes bacterium]|nr:sodium-dependent transporter [Bacillota bacterium]
MTRDRWNSRSTFILAAIGSAVGLGNAWRFPGIAYQNGGGAFLIPYVIALLTAGIPLLALELAIGKKFQAGAPTAFRSLNKKFEWIGWWGVGTAFCITAYYSVVLAWVINYVGLSLTSPWINKSSSTIFLADVLNISPGMFELGGFSPFVLLALIIGWLCIWYCIRNGVASVGSVVKYTVILPIILLVVLIVRAITLPGAFEGLKYYLVPDWSALLDVNVWAAAYGQIFFSLSILFAIMVAYGSYLNKDAEVTKDALIIGFADAGISFLSGFAAFGTLGYLANVSGTSIADMKHTGIMLAFVTYPEALAQMPGGKVGVILFSLVFFIMLFTLAIDSAFSIVEAVITALVDKFGWDKKKTTLWTCVAGFLSSLIFATKAGLYWLDIVDHFVNDFNLIAIGLCECVAVGWIYGAPKLRAYLNSNTDFKYGKWWDVCIQYICPLVFLFISVTYLINNILNPYDGYPLTNLLVAGWGAVALTFVFGLVMSTLKGKDDLEDV